MSDDSALPISSPRPPGRAAWALRAGFLLAAILCFTGVLGSGMDAAMRPVHASNAAYLEKSLAYSGGVIAGIAALRAGVSVVESGSVKFLGTGLEPGRAVAPVNDLLADISDYMLAYAVLIVAQMALTGVIKAVSVKFIIGAGALLCCLGIGRFGALMRTGLLLIITGLVLYVIYPLVLMGSAGIFESHQARASLELTQNVDILRKQAGALLDELRSMDSIAGVASGAGGIFARFLSLASGGAAALWRATLDLMVSMVIMFVLTPLAALGASYLLIRQSVGSIEGAARAGEMERRLLAAIGRLRQGGGPLT